MRLRSNDVTWREIDGEMVVLDLASSTYLTSNHTGTLLLRLLVQDCSHAELASALVDEYGISDQRADADVLVFTNLLHDHGLLAIE